jgi:hypothetical protein
MKSNFISGIVITTVFIGVLVIVNAVFGGGGRGSHAPARPAAAPAGSRAAPTVQEDDFSVFREESSDRYADMPPRR